MEHRCSSTRTMFHSVLMPPLKRFEEPTIWRSALLHINQVKRTHCIQTASPKQPQELNGKLAETWQWLSRNDVWSPVFFFLSLNWHCIQSLCDEVDKQRWRKGTICVTVLSRPCSHRGTCSSFCFYRSQGAVMGPTIGAPYPT